MVWEAGEFYFNHSITAILRSVALDGDLYLVQSCQMCGIVYTFAAGISHIIIFLSCEINLNILTHTRNLALYRMVDKQIINEPLQFCFTLTRMRYETSCRNCSTSPKWVATDLQQKPCFALQVRPYLQGI